MANISLGITKERECAIIQQLEVVVLLAYF